MTGTKRKVASDISAFLGNQLLQEGLRLRFGTVEDALARIRSPIPDTTPASLLLDIRDHTLRDGLTVRSYIPLQHRPSGLLINVHGGGWVAGSIERDNARCCALSERIGCLTISVGYRLAPEAPFPAPVNDCVDAIAWAVEQSRAFRIPTEHVAILGASAGANLAVAGLMRIAAEKQCPMPARQILLYPMCDARPDYPSYRENARGYFLSADDVAWYWDRYADKESRHDPHASILRAKNFSMMPPGLLVSSEFDPLRDEGEALGQRFRDDGVAVKCVRYLGAIHGFLSLTPESRLSELLLNQIVSELLNAFAIQSMPAIETVTS